MLAASNEEASRSLSPPCFSPILLLLPSNTLVGRALPGGTVGGERKATRPTRGCPCPRASAVVGTMATEEDAAQLAATGLAGYIDAAPLEAQSPPSSPRRNTYYPDEAEWDKYAARALTEAPDHFRKG